MDSYDCIATKLQTREFSPKEVPPSIKRRVLDAGRLAGSGMNSQHWRFILIERPDNIKKLSEDSTSGRWVRSANFAVVILTDPKYGFHAFDAGRAVQNMELAAWNYGVGSGLFTGINREALKKDFEIPAELSITAVVGFGYPKENLHGKKDRKPLEELAFSERYGNRLEG